MAIDITTKAMLVSLSIKGIGGWQIEDVQITKEVAQQHGTSTDVGKYIKRLLDPKKVPELGKVTAAAAALRAEHYKRTLPWGEDTTRILPATLYFDHTSGMTEAKDVLVSAQEVFWLRLPDLEQQAKIDLGPLYRAQEWPTVDQLRRRFSVGTKIWPLSDAGDFRCSFGEEHDALIRKEMEQNMIQNLAGSHVEIFKKLKDFIAGTDTQLGFIQRLDNYKLDAQGKTIGTFRDSVVSGLVEILDIADKQNILDNPQLSDLLAGIRSSLCARPASDLRDDAFLRANTIENAKQIVQNVEAFENAFSQLAA